MTSTAAGGKEVRGWLGVGPHAPRPQLDLSEEGYTQKPLSALDLTSLNAKLTLLTCPDPNGIPLYDHLVTMVTNVLEAGQDNPVVDLEAMSADLKTSRLRTRVNFKELPDPGRSQGQAKAEYKLFKTIARPIPNAEPEKVAPVDEDKENEFLCLPNLMRQAHLFAQAGFGLPAHFYVRITLALRELARAWPLVSLRFWGVIHGLQGEYTIAEGELREGEYNTHFSDEADDDRSMKTSSHDDVNKEDDVFDEMSEDIKPVCKPPRKIPCEHAGVGLNRKVYFVCSQPGLPWVRLPHVTPAQIQVARKIRKYFTGDLDYKLVTFPPFPGTERNYLRAQIARISAATHVSPIGVFKFEEDGEEEENEGGGVHKQQGARDTCVVDVEFEGLKMSELTDPSLMSWVHHATYILPQGRTTWFNPVQKGGEEEGEEEDEERNEPDEPEPEVGPPLLTPLAEDVAGHSGQPSWIARSSSKLVPEYAVASVQSVIWPGAVAVATDKGRFFENIYIGWGQKASFENFEPAIPEEPMEEFPTGPEVIETEDPTPETEAAIRAAMREQEGGGAEDEDGIIDDDDVGPDLDD